MAGTIIPPAFNETTNPTLISFFVANHFSQIAFKSGKSAKDLAVAFIRRTTGAVFDGTLIIGFL
jgi:uncharacterized membrane protein required for colicin V production